MAVIKIKTSALNVANTGAPTGLAAGELAYSFVSGTGGKALVIGTATSGVNEIVGGSAFFDTIGKIGTGFNVLATAPTLSGAVSITGATASLTVGTDTVYVATTLYGTLAVYNNVSLLGTTVTLADTTTIKGTSGTGTLNIWPGNAVNTGTLAVSGNVSISGNLNVGTTNSGKITVRGVDITNGTITSPIIVSTFDHAIPAGTAATRNAVTATAFKVSDATLSGNALTVMAAGYIQTGTVMADFLMGPGENGRIESISAYTIDVFRDPNDANLNGEISANRLKIIAADGSTQKALIDIDGNITANKLTLGSATAGGTAGDIATSGSVTAASFSATGTSTFSGVTSFSYGNGIGFKDFNDTASFGVSPSYFLRPPTIDLTSVTGIHTFLLPITAGTTNTSTDSLVSLTSSDVLTNKTLTSPIITTGSVISTALATTSAAITIQPSTANATVATTLGALTLNANTAVGGRLTITEVVTATATGSTALAIVPANHTAVTAETPAFSVAANTLTITTGFPTSGVQRFNRFTAPTIAGAAAGLTVATAATVAITGAPTPGANTPTLSASYALLVEAGDVLFKGLIKAGTSSTVLTDAAGKIVTAALNTVGVAQGGTGVAAFTANGVLYGNSATSILVTAAGAANTVLTGQGSGAAPSFSSTPTLGRLTLTDTATTSGATLVVTPGARSSSGSENTSGITVATNTLTISANNTGLQRFNVFTAPTIAASAGSLSVATSATVSIAGAPISGTNTPTLTSNFALLVEAGDVGFKGIIKAGSGLISITDSTGKLSLGSSTVTGTLPVTSGGTGLSSGYVLGDMLYVSANTPTIARLPIMSTGYILAGGTIPGWTSTPQVAQLYLNSTSNQLVYTAGAGGYFGTLSWPSVTIANKTITLPDLAGTVMLTSGTQTIGIGVAWNGTIITPAYGGTGVDNGVKTITLVGNFATAGAGTYATTLTVTAATNVTLPTSGTLATTAYVDSVAQGLHVHPPADVILTQTLANVISNELSFVYNGSTIIITGTTANNLIFSADAIPVADVPIGNLAAAATTATTLTFSNTVSNTWPYSIDSSGVWLFDIPIGTPIIGSSIATGTVTTSAIVTGDLASTVNLTISKALTAPITAGAANYSFVIGWTRIVIAGETVTTASTMVPNKEWHGIYTKTTTTNTSITLTRAIDADVITDLSGGDFIFIQRGQQYSDTGFVQTASTILTGVFANANGFMPVFVQFSQAGIILAGDGLAKTGNILKVVGTANSITVASGGAVSVSTTYAGGTYITTVGTVATGTIDGGTF